MIFLIALLEAILFVFFFKNAIRKHPAVFYVLSIAIIGFIVCYTKLNLYEVFPVWTYQYIISVFYRGAFSTALFVIVMYIGALDPKGKIVPALMPIRGYLSIIACLITLAHSFAYGIYYIAAIFQTPDKLDLRQTLALILTIPLFSIMIILMVTSFKAVRKKMKPRVWKKVQRLSYPWFAILYVYLMVLLVPSLVEALSPSSDMVMLYRVNYMLSVILYTLVFGVYFVLRIRKFQKSR
ncbi:ferric reductase-like transmembrane domain-containing protein [Lacrimispora amygdalina]|uniref:ferric reductase-like transmembrane domain-containing protein n=1 Tax=Lacrimispora amygdalina TaxID=253257 RepID=UPI000BE3CB12|nr:ferric reductase-like transmembrane domain-containing protein [Lacrimispora amygdalina]